jgi:hypothetical protein
MRATRQDILNMMRERILILDGATGTYLQQHFPEETKAEAKGCNDYLCLARPDLIKKMHQDYIAAGADIIETNSFNSNRFSLADYGLQDKVYEINKAAARIAREAADSPLTPLLERGEQLQESSTNSSLKEDAYSSPLLERGERLQTVSSTLSQEDNTYSSPLSKRGVGGESITFPKLLAMVAEAVPKMRVRFTTSHPKDMSDETLEVIARYPNVCKHIHLPVQSGSDRILKLMNRKYTREWYMGRVEAIKRIVPECAITTDIFVGYHSETEEDHQMSLSLMREVGYASAFMFKYSERPGTYASKHLPDDVPEDVKIRRLNEMIALQNELSAISYKADEGKEFEVLVEGYSKRSREQLCGRTSQNKMVVFDKGNHHIGDLVKVRITGSTSATLFGEEV